MATVEAEEVKALLILVAMLIAVGIFLLVVWRAWRQRQVQKDLQLPSDSKIPMAPQRISTTSASEEGSGPIIAVNSVQPRPFFRRHQTFDDFDEGIEEEEVEKERDLGRLYFALKYETLSSTLIIKLLRGEDIPANGKTKATYVDVNLIPLNGSESLQFTPHQTTLNITFRETYQFPLSPQDLSYQTIHFHICRYDVHSRREDIGEVFLALAELVAQGIDITREVYLCRNLISYQRIPSQKRCLTDSERSGSEIDNGETSKPARKRKPGELWDKLRSAVMEREFIVPTPLMWEPLFYQSGSANGSPTGVQFASPAEEADYTEYYSLTESGECAEAAMENANAGDFSISDSDFEIVWDNPQGPRTPHFSFSSDFESTPLDIDPAPEDYYKITPQMTPFGKEPLISWPVPQTFTPGRSRQGSTEVPERKDEHDGAALPRNYSTDFSPARSKIRRTGSFTRTGAVTAMLSEQTKTNASFTKSRHKLPARPKKRDTALMSRLKFSFQKFKKEKSDSDDNKNKGERGPEGEMLTKKSESETDSDQGGYISVQFTLQTDCETTQQHSSKPEQGDASRKIAQVASEIERFTGTRNWDLLDLPPREEGDGGSSEPVTLKQEECQSDVYLPTSEDEVARESSDTPWKLRAEHTPKSRRKRSKSREPVKKLSQGSVFSRRTRKSPGLRKKKASSSPKVSSSDESQ